MQEIVELNRRCKRSNRSNLCLLTGAWLISLSLLCNQSSECTVLTFLSQSNFNIHPSSVASLWKKKLATYLEGKRRWYAQLSSHQSEQSASLISALPYTLHRLYQELCRAVPWLDRSGFIVCTSTAGVRQEPHQAHSSRGDKVATLLLCHYHPPPATRWNSSSDDTEECLTGKIQKRAHQDHTTHQRAIQPTRPSFPSSCFICHSRTELRMNNINLKSKLWIN